MDYKDAMDYIGQLGEQIGSTYSLTDVAALSDEAGRPERKLNIIHIAGTNGKGSVSNYISNILAMSGYMVGKYVSPTLTEYRERIQKVVKSGDGTECEFISEEQTAEILTRLRGYCEQLMLHGFSQPSAFEMETIMAFLAFEEWQVDYAVIETGLGGMVDATNIIEKPLQCIFTSLSLEHQRVLGDSIMKIAKEKYGIIKKNAQVISAKNEEAFSILEEQVRRKNAVLYPVSEEALSDVQFKEESTTFSYHGVSYTLKQLGTFQVENALLAIESTLHLREKGAEKITEDAIQKGLEISRWSGRFDVISKDPYIVADGAHNPDAVRRFVESLETYFHGEKLDMVFGVLADKDYAKMIEYLCPFMERVYTVMPENKRGLPAGELKRKVEEISEKSGYSFVVTACETLEDALKQAKEHAGERRICVCGSLYLLSGLYQKK